MKKKFLLALSIILLFNVIAQTNDIAAKRAKKDNYAKQKENLFKGLYEANLQETDNQSQYDAVYYSLDLDINPGNNILSGTVEMVGKVIGASLDKVDINFWEGMTITDIHISSDTLSQLSYSLADDVISVTLDKNYFKGELFRISISYSGNPSVAPGFFGYSAFNFDSHEGKNLIWTISEPSGARTWWPCKDIPSDKADSVDIRVTVPSNLIVASNGLLREKTVIGDKTTYWWHEQYPITTYLVALAIYEYEVNLDHYVYNDGADSMQIQFYSFPGNYSKYAEINAKVKDMITVFSELFGQYPFIKEKYGHADFNFHGGAMEHQTCSGFGAWNEGIYAHELAHQWWGDLVTVESWNHIWLAEGLADYSEALWEEKAYGNAPGKYMKYYQSYYGPGTIYVEEPLTDNIFEVNLSYKKASWVFHMLRKVVGEEKFWEIIKTFASSEQFRFKSATTEEFQSLCEEISRIKLDKFFQQWIYGEYFPEYKVEWDYSQKDSKYEVELTITQTQTNQLFWMPIEIFIHTPSGTDTTVVWDSLQTQKFTFSANEIPLEIEIDKDNWILKKVEQPLINPKFDKGILLVNGVSFFYNEEIYNCYNNKAFSGEYKFDFWDFADQSDNYEYPDSLPTPIGYGPIPNKILSNYSTIIWVGNNFEGDLISWEGTQINSYLEAGGNLILLTRYGGDFLNDHLMNYLGITWLNSHYATFNNCISSLTGLVDMEIDGRQNYNGVFEKSFTQAETKLLFEETLTFGDAKGIGAWRKPVDGGKYKKDGGQFVFISGRPYRWNKDHIKSNIEYILGTLFYEDKIVGAADLYDTLESFSLKQNYPNPFNPQTTIEYNIPFESFITVELFNVLGQKVKTLCDETKKAGNYKLNVDLSGFASGIYYYKLTADSFTETKKLILVK